MNNLFFNPNLNRTRLECKVTPSHESQFFICIWIEPDWNVKDNYFIQVLHYLNLNRTRLECKEGLNLDTLLLWPYLNRTRLECKVRGMSPKKLEKKHLNRTRLECKEARTSWDIIRCSYLNRTRLECKVGIYTVKRLLMIHLNRTRLECKGLKTIHVSTLINIWIEPDWNVKV